MSSLRRVAEHAGVSIATVSRVLNNTGGKAYSASTSDRVRAAAAELGYRPNLLMRGVAGRSTRTVGVLAPLAGTFYTRVLEGIHDRLAEQDYAMILVWSKEFIPSPDSDVERKELHRVIDRRVDGVILRPTHESVSDLYFQEVWERHIPLVAVDRTIPGVHCDFAGTDDIAVGRLAAEHLLGLGHRVLGHLAGPSSVSTARDRRTSFEQAVAAFGDGARCLTVEGPDYIGRQEARQLLRAEPRPTAIFAANDDLAASVYEAAAQAGIRIPDDLAVVGCGNLPKGLDLRPTLTTFDQNPHRIGREAARLLLERTAGKDKQSEPRQVRVMPELIVRESSVQTVVSSVAIAHAADCWVCFSDDGQRIVVKADGFAAFEGVSSAVYERDGKADRVGAGHVKLGPVHETVGDTPFGEAVVSSVTYGNGDFQYTLILKRLKALRAFTLQGTLHNRGDVDVKYRTIDLLDLTRQAGGKLVVDEAAEVLVTPLMEASPALPLGGMDKRLNEAALVYRGDGNGFLVGPVGPAEAFTAIEVRNGALKAEVLMDGVLVRAGESRRGEEMIFSFEPVRTSTDIWTRWVAETHGVRRKKGAVYGWCSWYDRTTKIDADHVLDVTKTIEANPNTFGKGVIQIDDGYQKMDGDWSANEKFPMGMAAVAKRIRDAGCMPGVWFAPLMIHPEHPWAKTNPDAIQTNAKGVASFMNANPFHPDGANWVNPDHSKSKEFLYRIIRDARDRGYGYIKIDFNGIGSRFVDPTKTRLQVFRELYALYREAAGNDMYILSCLGHPTRGVIGFVDSSRVGPDSHPAYFDKCLDSVLRFQIYDNIWWRNDPDVSYLAQKLESRELGPTPQGEGMWRTWHGIVALVGGTAMVSEPLNAPEAKAVWRNYEIMRPGSREPARLLTLGKSAHNTTFGFAANRPFGDFAVYNLYNGTGETTPITLDFREAGLPPGVKCAVYDFWSNQAIGTATDTYTTAPLETHSSALLRFTPLIDGRPVLVGSDLHLSMGATEIDDVRISPCGMDIALNDAGAQNGSLTFYSEKPLAAASSEHCEITSVQNLGDSLWRVNIAGRQWGTAQQITLKIGGRFRV